MTALDNASWLEQVEVFGGRCAYCLKPLTGTYQLDHVVALSRGGEGDIENVVPACPSCNTRKSDLPVFCMVLPAGPGTRLGLAHPPRSQSLFSQKFIRCGNARCKPCRDPDAYPHGPYFYAYRTDADGRTRWKYLGKKKPKG